MGGKNNREKNRNIQFESSEKDNTHEEIAAEEQSQGRREQNQAWNKRKRVLRGKKQREREGI